MTFALEQYKLINSDSVPEDGSHWFRAKGDVRTKGYDPYDERFFPISPVITVSIRPYMVIKVTPKGVWLRVDGYYGQKRFVLRDARKRWACPTRSEAIESLRARNARRRLLLSSQLRDAELLAKYMDSME